MGDVVRRWWQKPLVKPRALQAGDRVAIVSTSWGGPAVFPHRYEAGRRYLTEAFGLEPVAMPYALRDAAWLDRNPAGAGRRHPHGFRRSLDQGDHRQHRRRRCDPPDPAYRPERDRRESEGVSRLFRSDRAAFRLPQGRPRLFLRPHDHGGLCGKRRHACLCRNLAAEGRLRDGAHRRDRAECGGVDRRASALGRSGQPEPPPRAAALDRSAGPAGRQAPSGAISSAAAPRYWKC